MRSHARPPARRRSPARVSSGSVTSGWRGAVMVCGTASDVGKSRLVAGLCRLLARNGVRVAPFKAQNMALNSFVTEAGHEIGRSQASQAMAAGVEPEAAMNPVLLKPNHDHTSQVVVMGRPVGTCDFGAYRDRAAELRPVVLVALADLRRRFEVVVCEGAGGAAEINLLDGDVVNLPLAAEAGVPVVLVGDIERGGVFAALHGSVDLLPGRYRDCVRGFVVNKMRGDASWLSPGLAELERRHGIPVLGVLPFIDGVHLDAEDSLALGQGWPAPSAWDPHEDLDVAVVGLPRMSNVTDLDPLVTEPGVGVRLVRSPALGDPDLVVVPGTKATVADLEWLEERGLARALGDARRRRRGPVFLGLCGGGQMLGRKIHDPVESGRGWRAGLGLLEVDTVFEPDKVVRRRAGSALGAPVHGYEIHHGRTRLGAAGAAWMALHDGGGVEHEGCRSDDGRVFGTSVHGLFESDDFRAAFLSEVAARRGKVRSRRGPSFAAVRAAHFDQLADVVETHLDLDGLEAIVTGAG